MQKVLVVGPLPPPPGGMATVVDMMMNSSILKEKYQLLNLNTNKSGNRTSLIMLFKQFFSLLKYLFDRDIKIVHFHTSSGNALYKYLIMSVFSFVFNKEVIVQIHGGRFKKFYRQKPRVIQKLIVIFLKKVSLIIVLGNVWKEHMISVLKISEHRLEVLNNPVKEKNVLKSFDNNINYKGIFIGNVSYQKGMDLIIRICEALKKDNINVKFDIIGNGKVNKWQEIAVNKGVDDNLNFVGEVLGEELKYRYLLDSDFLILPSRYECFPMVILEAMSIGLPVIASDIGSIPEMIEEGINGFTCHYDDIDKYVEGIKKLYEKDKQIKNMSQNNIKKARGKYNYITWQNKLLSIYSRLEVGENE